MILTSAGIIYSVSGDGIVSVGNDLYELYGPKFSTALTLRLGISMPMDESQHIEWG